MNALIARRAAYAAQDEARRARLAAFGLDVHGRPLPR